MGKLGGTGAIAGNVANAGGTIAPGGVSKPGDAPGVLTILGNLTEAEASKLDIALGGTTPGTEYSQLIVDGAASLLGSLDLNLVDGFSPTNGQTFDIVGTGDGLTDGVTSLSLDGGACWTKGGGFECNSGAFFDLFTLSVVPRAGRRYDPGRSRAERLDDSRAGAFDLGDDAGRVCRDWLPRLPGFAQGWGGGISTNAVCRGSAEEGTVRRTVVGAKLCDPKAPGRPKTRTLEGRAVSPDSDQPLRWPVAKENRARRRRSS
jgi:hypothetical protein